MSIFQNTNLLILCLEDWNLIQGLILWRSMKQMLNVSVFIRYNNGRFEISFGISRIFLNNPIY